ncbi:MAG: energy transducer TonB, partial [Candidatus Nephrothrix sp. EaCA]
PRALLRGVLTSLLILGAICSYPMIAKWLAEGEEKELPPMRTINYSELEMPPPLNKNEPPPPKIDLPPPVKKTIKFVPPKVTAKEVEDEKMPEIEELKKVEVSTVTQEGVGSIVIDEPVREVAKDTTDVNRNKVFLIVENQPEFPGGNTALMKYLGNNIRYPSSARRMGIEGKVMIQFVVNQAGEIADVKVLRGLSGDCDNEAMRVIKSMPKWKPGRQGGRPVKVQMVVPVNYRLE